MKKSTHETVVPEKNTFLAALERLRQEYQAKKTYAVGGCNFFYPWYLLGEITAKSDKEAIKQFQEEYVENGHYIANLYSFALLRIDSDQFVTVAEHLQAARPLRN